MGRRKEREGRGSKSRRERIMMRRTRGGQERKSREEVEEWNGMEEKGEGRREGEEWMKRRTKGDGWRG